MLRSKSSLSVSSSSSSSSSSALLTYDEEIDASLATTPRDARKANDRRPKSTWYLKPVRNMNLAECVQLVNCTTVCRGVLQSETVYTIKPLSLDRGPVPKKSVLEDNFWILSHTIPFFIIQSLLQDYLGYVLPIYLAYPLYFLHTIFYLKSAIRRMDIYMVKWGVMDEKNVGRDRTPDNSTKSLAIGIASFLFLRTAITLSFYDSSNSAVLGNFSWLSPFKLFAFQFTLDYLFYSYHRSTHQFDSLWKIHSKHHSTQHPTPILSILAGEYQEMLEVFLLPLFSALLVNSVLPINFHEFSMIMSYVSYIEILGHSGIRAHWKTPALAFVLGPLCGEILDHENHHNHGKSGKNFGKQSMVFDWLFGTVTKRLPIE